MNKTILSLAALVTLGFFACTKSDTASATEVVVGQQVSVSIASTANASNWTVTPAATATQAYALTTSKTNYFTFSAPGVYTVSVRARSVAFDSTRQSLTNAWNAGGGSQGSCTKGIDTASVAITVTGK